MATKKSVKPGKRVRRDMKVSLRDPQIMEKCWALLHPIGVRRGAKALYTTAELAEHFGKSPSHIGNLLRVRRRLILPLLDEYRAGYLTTDHVFQLCKLSESEQKAAYERGDHLMRRRVPVKSVFDAIERLWILEKCGPRPSSGYRRALDDAKEAILRLAKEAETGQS